MKEEVNKSELAKAVGKSGASITKIVKAGVLDGCFTPHGKIYLQDALIAIGKYKGHDYIKPVPIKPFFELNQLEVIEMVEREKKIKFERPGENTFLTTNKRLKDGSFGNWIPKALVTVSDVRKYLKNSFTDDEIQNAISEVNSFDRNGAFFELLNSFIQDDEISLYTIRQLYKKILEAFFNADEIAFYMDDFLRENE